MTTANLLNVSPAKGVQVNVSKKLQEEAREVTEIFASMMNQTMDMSNPVADDAIGDISVQATESGRTIQESYERYNYKDNKIDAAKDEGMTPEEQNVAEEAVEEAEQEIITTLKENYGVDEETITAVLEEMGLNPIDLLNPQNLVGFLMELTGALTPEELLLDGNFLTVMSTFEQLSEGLMEQLSVDEDGLGNILAQMETGNVEDLEAGIEQIPDTKTEGVKEEATVTGEVTLTEQKGAMEDAEDVSEEVISAQDVSDEEQLKQEEIDPRREAIVTDSEEGSQSEQKDGKLDDILVGTNNHKEGGREGFLFERGNTGGENLMNQDNNSGIVMNQMGSVTSNVADVPQMQLQSFMSVDTAQIIQQLAEQIKVVVTPDISSMEMQLNPENLGKVFLHISAEEGVISAQFRATNEIVKEALETQIATLRDNLNQAGVKVDSIEVTIASHEFERNLEQNQQKPEEQLPQENAPKRRNLHVDSLDELSGVMTEEETLAAQIMKDNGNSVDFTA